ncbi:hypothetical protein J1614_006645 [Plenodomus biglobosus]|nr:hypothetical protein J1614_006645 [Plenodomus biglobosus]
MRLKLKFGEPAYPSIGFALWRCALDKCFEGRKGVYELLQSLKGSTALKPRVLCSLSQSANWTMIKTADSADRTMALRRDHLNYDVNEIASSQHHIRAMCDTMDQDLTSVSKTRFRGDPKLRKAVSKAVLSALEVMRSLNALHTDITPNNIFLSDIDGPSPFVKVGDVGVTIANISTTQ